MASVHSFVYRFIQQTLTVAFWVPDPILGPKIYTRSLNTKISRIGGLLSKNSTSSGWDGPRNSNDIQQYLLCTYCMPDKVCKQIQWWER